MAGNGAVYWLGQDGNIYLKAPNIGGAGKWGVQNYGKPIGYGSSATNWNAGFDAAGGSAEATPISDPKAPFGGGAANTAPSNPTGAGGGSQYQDKSLDIGIQNAGLSASDAKTQKGIDAINAQLAGILGNYDTESTNAEGQYKGSSDTNVGNKLKNDESALVNAAQGRRGLFGSLASIGALGGTGIELANRAVQQGANEDLGNSEDSYKGNQTSLDTAIGNFRTADKERRDQSNSAAENARTSAKNEGAKEKQAFLTNIANDYHDQGDSATAKKYADMAAALYGDISNTAVPSAGPSYISAAFQAPTLSSYKGNSGTTVNSTPENGSGGLPGLFAGNPLFTGNDKKKVTA